MAGIKRLKTTVVSKGARHPSKLSSEYVVDSESDGENQSEIQQRIAPPKSPGGSPTRLSSLKLFETTKAPSNSRNGRSPAQKSLAITNRNTNHSHQPFDLSNDKNGGSKSEEDGGSSSDAESTASSKPNNLATPSSAPQPKSSAPSTVALESIKEDSPSIQESNVSNTESESDEGNDIRKYTTIGSSARESNELQVQRIRENPTQPKSQVAPVQLYKPPQGFEPVRIKSSSFTAATLLSPTNLAGKQLWYISIPACIPPNTIKDISLEKLQNGQATMSFGAAEYGFDVDTESQHSRKELLVPNQRDNDYRPTRIKIDRTLHFRQIPRLPGLVTGSSGLSDHRQLVATTVRPKLKPIRQQPEGMKMRYRAFGDVDYVPARHGLVSPESFEGGFNSQAFRLPPGLNSPRKSKKRKVGKEGTHNTVDDHNTPSERKRRKKPGSESTTRVGYISSPEKWPTQSLSNGHDGEGDKEEPDQIAEGNLESVEDNSLLVINQDKASRKEERRRQRTEKRQKNMEKEYEKHLGRKGNMLEDK